MTIEATNKPKSLGKLRKNSNAKSRAPVMIGTLRLQRHTAAIILAFENGNDEAVCNIAAWVNHDHEGQYLTVEISPKYVTSDPQGQRASPLAFIFDNEEDRS